MPRLRFRAPRSPSKLEDRFLFLWQIAKAPPLEREFRFHADSTDSRAELTPDLPRNACSWHTDLLTDLKCRISKMITDEVESTVEEPGQMRLL